MRPISEMLSSLGTSGNVPELIEAKAGESILSNAVPKNPPEIKFSDFLGSSNRAFRRQFKRKHGIFLPGTNKPVVNNNKKK